MTPRGKSQRLSVNKVEERAVSVPGDNVTISQYIVLHDTIKHGLDRLIKRHPPGVEIFVEGSAWWDPGITRVLDDFRAVFPGRLSVHPPAWGINIASYTKPIRDMSIDVYRKTIETASRLDATYVVLHVGFRGVDCFSRAECMTLAEEGIRSLASYARGMGVGLAVENVGWFGSEICDQEEFTALVHRSPDGVGALLDVGHALLTAWDIPAAVRDLGPRMIAMHLHDNDGTADQHLPIGKGKIDWKALITELPKTATGCEYVLEYAPGTPLETLEEGHDLLSRFLATTP